MGAESSSLVARHRWYRRAISAESSATRWIRLQVRVARVIIGSSKPWLCTVLSTLLSRGRSHSFRKSGWPPLEGGSAWCGPHRGQLNSSRVGQCSSRSATSDPGDRGNQRTRESRLLNPLPGTPGPGCRERGSGGHPPKRNAEACSWMRHSNSRCLCAPLRMHRGLPPRPGFSSSTNLQSVQCRDGASFLDATPVSPRPRHSKESWTAHQTSALGSCEPELLCQLPPGYGR